MGAWEEFDRPQKPEPSPDEFAELCALTLSSGTGAKLLEMFRVMTIEKILPDGAHENALRALEAQRHFVRRIEAATARGIKQIGPAKG